MQVHGRGRRSHTPVDPLGALKTLAWALAQSCYSDPTPHMGSGSVRPWPTPRLRLSHATLGCDMAELSSNSQPVLSTRHDSPLLKEAGHDCDCNVVSCNHVPLLPAPYRCA